MTKREAEVSKVRCDRATPGPWSRKRPDGDVGGFKRGMAVAATSGRQMIWADPLGGSMPSADCDFIANARQDLPSALADRRALIEALKPFTGWLTDGERQAATEHAVELLCELGELDRC